MSGLHGKKAEDFVKWLDKARYVLPRATTLIEARNIWQEKQDELKYGNTSGKNRAGCLGGVVKLPFDTERLLHENK